ncbi:MAG TPA: hypothetical protein VK463_04175 [Desulfomonilaceae bacterium]|nr:hypothetical protein [Desulfomonilaceae bacterium]
MRQAGSGWNVGFSEDASGRTAVFAWIHVYIVSGTWYGEPYCDSSLFSRVPRAEPAGIIIRIRFFTGNSIPGTG